MNLVPIIVYADAAGTRASVAWVPPAIDAAIRLALGARP